MQFEDSPLVVASSDEGRKSHRTKSRSTGSAQLFPGLRLVSTAATEENSCNRGGVVCPALYTRPSRVRRKRDRERSGVKTAFHSRLFLDLMKKQMERGRRRRGSPCNNYLLWEVHHPSYLIGLLLCLPPPLWWLAETRFAEFGPEED